MTRALAKKRKPVTRATAGSGSTQPPVVVLLSGGIDSACVLVSYRAAKHRVNALFVDYGQPARRSELAAARAIADRYDVPLQVVKISAPIVPTDGEYFGRNALLVLLGAALSPHKPLIVGMGVHSASPYYDTTSAFAKDMQRVLDGYAAGAVVLGAPFLTMTKPTIVRFARRHRVPLALTYSCVTKDAPQCGECPSCADRKVCRVD